MRLLNNLCLLEPLVAIAWQAIFAKAAAVALEGHHYALLFAGLWLGYAADRWLDVRSATPEAPRHVFAHRHCRSFLRAWLVLFASALALAFWKLSLREWGASLALAGSGIAYLSLVHAPIGNPHVAVWRARLLRKELWVSVIYGAGVGVLVWCNTVPSLALLVAQALFAALVLLNLLGIARLEANTDTLQSQWSLARTRRASASAPGLSPRSGEP